MLAPSFYLKIRQLRYKVAAFFISGHTVFIHTWQNMDSTSKFSRLNFEARQSFKLDQQAGEYSLTGDTIMLKAGEPGRNKTMVLLKGKYQFLNNALILHSDGNRWKFKKVIRKH